MTRKSAGERKKAIVLPVVRLENTAYFIDLSLRHFRETMNPRNYVDFDSVKGERLWSRACAAGQA